MSARVIDLGGATTTCSAMRVRRLKAGELSDADAALTTEHLRTCARCAAVVRELEEEARALAKLLPFDELAAGVAERLAGGAQPAAVVSLTARRRWQRWVLPGSIAAGLAVLVSSAVITRYVAERSRAVQGLPVEPEEVERIRLKGGDAPRLELFALRAGRSFQLSPGERAERGDRLLVVLPAPPRAYVSVLLQEGHEVSVLFRGPARAGPLPEAFEWTGEGQRGRLVALYTELPADLTALTERLARGEAPSMDVRDVTVLREVQRR